MDQRQLVNWTMNSIRSCSTMARPLSTDARRKMLDAAQALVIGRRPRRRSRRGGVGGVRCGQDHDLPPLRVVRRTAARGARPRSSAEIPDVETGVAARRPDRADAPVRRHGDPARNPRDCSLAVLQRAATDEDFRTLQRGTDRRTQVAAATAIQRGIASWRDRSDDRHRDRRGDARGSVDRAGHARPRRDFRPGEIEQIVDLVLRAVASVTAQRLSGGRPAPVRPLDRDTPRDKTPPMATAVIVDAVRTPMGKRNGKLKEWHPVDLAAEMLTALAATDAASIPASSTTSILGCVMQVGEQAANVARNAVLAAGWPEDVPGTTVDRQCGSSQQAAHFAAQGVIAGAYDVVVAGGVEVMTRVPMGSSMADGKYGYPFGPRIGARYADSRWPGAAGDLGRADRRPVGDQPRGDGRVRCSVATACAAGGRARADSIARSSRSSAPTVRRWTRDEGSGRRRSRRCRNSSRRSGPIDDGGRVTAGNSSQITDGAAALLIMSETRRLELGLTPRARFVDFAIAGADPRLMLTAPIPATSKVLERAGLCTSTTST